MITKLEWVLSGPLKERTEAGTITVNPSVSKSASYPVGGPSPEGNVNKLWELETLTIREDESMHEPLFENIFFNGTRYSVRLP